MRLEPMVFQNDGFLCQWLVSWNRQSGLSAQPFSPCTVRQLMRHRRVLSDFYWLTASTQKSANTKGLRKDACFSLFFFLFTEAAIDPPHTFWWDRVKSPGNNTISLTNGLPFVLC